MEKKENAPHTQVSSGRLIIRNHLFSMGGGGREVVKCQAVPHITCSDLILTSVYCVVIRKISAFNILYVFVQEKVC